MSTALRVTVVKEGTQAERLGIKPGDIVSTYDRVNLTSNHDLTNAASKAKEENKKYVDVVIVRDGAEMTFQATMDRLGIDCVEYGTASGGHLMQSSDTVSYNTEYVVATCNNWCISSIAGFKSKFTVIIRFFLACDPSGFGYSGEWLSISYGCPSHKSSS